MDAIFNFILTDHLRLFDRLIFYDQPLNEQKNNVYIVKQYI